MLSNERKKIILFGSEHCINCGPVKEALESRGVKFSFVDITSGMPQLQYFMKVRDSSEAYGEIRGSGKIGIPCIQVNNVEYIPAGPEDTLRLIDELGLVW